MLHRKEGCSLRLLAGLPAHHTEDLSSSSPSQSIVVGHYSADAFPELQIIPQEALKHSFAYFVESVPWRNWGCLRTLETPVSHPSFLLPLAKVSPSLSLQRKPILGDLRLSSRACSMAVKSWAQVRGGKNRSK